MVRCTLIVATIVHDSEPPVQFFCHDCMSSWVLSQICHLTSLYTICERYKAGLLAPLRTLDPQQESATCQKVRSHTSVWKSQFLYSYIHKTDACSAPLLFYIQGSTLLSSHVRMSDDSIRDSSWSTVVVSLVELREIMHEGETAAGTQRSLEPHLALKAY